MSQAGSSSPLPLSLRLAPLGPALAALAAAALLLAFLLPGLRERAARRQLLEIAQTAAPLLADRAETPEALGDRLRRLGQERGIELAVILPLGAGTTLPETQEALANGQGTAARRNPLTGRQEIHAAVLVDGRGGRRWLLHATAPVAERHELARPLALALLLALGVAALALLPWSLWLGRRLGAPLSRLTAGLEELAAGPSALRLEIPQAEELAPATAALNRAAAAAETRFATLQQERDHLRSILAGMSEGVLVVSPDGRAVFANAAFCRIFELPGEITRRPVLELVRQPELARLVERTLASRQPHGAEIELQGVQELLDRPRRSLELASAALREEEGGGAVVVVRDITELNRLTEMRRDFVANVSHEIKTPLAVIRGYAETLRDGALEEPATAARFIERILSQSRRLQELLDDLLVLSRLESLDQPLRREPVALAPLLQRAVDLLEPAAADKEIEVEVELSPVPALQGDPNGLERMVTNLLANAIKYNRPGGEVLLRLSAAPNQVILEVSDTGIGIPVEARARIFERFYRVDKGRAREEGGTGLGLAIVKHVAQSHGGQIEVESRAGGGTTFRVALPVAATSNPTGDR